MKALPRCPERSATLLMATLVGDGQGRSASWAVTPLAMIAVARAALIVSTGGED